MNGRRNGITLSYIYTILNTVVGLFFSAYIIRMVGEIEYGLYQIMTSFVTYLTLFEFGTGTIMTRNISLCKKNSEEQDVLQKNISTIFSVVQILSAVILIVALTHSQIQYGKYLFLIMVVKLVATFYNQTFNGILLGFEHYSRATLISLFILVFRTIFLFVALKLYPKALLIVVFDTATSLIACVYTFLYCIKKFNISFKLKYFDKKIFRSIIPLALAMFLQVIVNQANGNVDKFVIGIVLSPEAVAVYSVALFIYTTFSSLTTIPISMYMPQVAKDIREGKSGFELTKTLVQPCRLIVLVGGAILFGFIAVGRQFITLMYGKPYIQAWLIAIVIMAPMFINMSNGILVNVLDVYRKRHVRSVALLITTVSNIFLTVWWIDIWGMKGAALATALCTLMGQILIMNIYYQKVIKIKVLYLFAQAYKGILIWFVLACVVAVGTSFLIKNTIVSFFCGGVIFCVVSACGMLLFGLNSTEKEMLKGILTKIGLVRGNKKA